MLIKLAITSIWLINWIAFTFSAHKNNWYCEIETRLWFFYDATSRRHVSNPRTSYKLKQFSRIYFQCSFTKFFFVYRSGFVSRTQRFNSYYLTETIVTTFEVSVTVHRFRCFSSRFRCWNPARSTRPLSQLWNRRTKGKSENQ